MQFTYTAGGPLPLAQTQTITFTDCDTNTVTSEAPSALTLTPTVTWVNASRSGPNAVKVTVNPSGLAAGAYSGTVNVTIPTVETCEAGAVFPIAVSLTVVAAPVSIPTIAFKTANNSTFNSNNKEFEVTVADKAGVTAVEMYVGSALKAITCQSVHKAGQKLPATVQLQWMESSIPKGTYLLTAIAYNASGGKAQAQITVKRI